MIEYKEFREKEELEKLGRATKTKKQRPGCWRGHPRCGRGNEQAAEFFESLRASNDERLSSEATTQASQDNQLMAFLAAAEERRP
jgi:hypothetical protein